MTFWEIVASILAGLSVCIPLAVKLVQVVRESARKGNWNKIVGMVAEYMSVAEEKIEDGATRKEWVIGMIRTSAGSIDYDLTEAELAKIGEMIDALCDMARTVNGPTTGYSSPETRQAATNNV